MRRANERADDGEHLLEVDLVPRVSRLTCIELYRTCRAWYTVAVGVRSGAIVSQTPWILQLLSQHHFLSPRSFHIITVIRKKNETGLGFVASDRTRSQNGPGLCKQHKKLSYRRDSACRRSLRRSRSFSVTEFGINRKPVCDFF